jgi:hypothetical protein
LKMIKLNVQNINIKDTILNPGTMYNQLL